MKKILFLFLALSFSICFSSCGNNVEEAATDNKKISIVSTIFPGYDLAKQIGGDKAEAAMLLPPGSESHSFDPSAKDMITIQNCDLFIYIGGESDSWVNKILEALEHPVRTIRMMDCVNPVKEEIVEGMQEEEHGHEHDETDSEHGEDGDAAYDEHVWTSPRNVIKITREISDALCEIDKENSEVYSRNSGAYVEALQQLDKKFVEFFDTVENKTLIFGDRFPFRYFADTYGIEYYAAFSGCATETEASPATVAFLINKVKSENISTVFYIEFSNHKIADSIAEATGAKTALLHSCHNISKDDMQNGATYLSLMEKNLTALKSAMTAQDASAADEEIKGEAE